MEDVKKQFGKKQWAKKKLKLAGGIHMTKEEFIQDICVKTPHTLADFDVTIKAVEDPASETGWSVVPIEHVFIEGQGWVAPPPRMARILLDYNLDNGSLNVTWTENNEGLNVYLLEKAKYLIFEQGKERAQAVQKAPE